MGLKAAVQALKKAEPLKDKVQRCKDLLNDSDAWVCQQQLQKIYQQVLILDLEYALDRKVEQELWNLGFKNYIATLQLQAKDRKNPKRGESQALLSWCLEAASGFYLTLLQEICTAFDLDLPFRRKGYVYGCTSPWKAVEKLSAPHKSSCFYACQYCLVHLGDIARYRNESRQAELFYRHAVSLSPSSGQPYNQLALLEASRGDKLGTVFHYARSVAVKHPFPVATANLVKTLSSALNDNSFNIDGKTKLNSQEYIAIFLKVHGIIHSLGDLKVAPSYVKLLTETLTALIVTESFSSWMLVQMLAINLYTLQYTAGSLINSTELLKIEHLSADEKIAQDCILDLIAGTLSALLLPVYTIKNSIVEYFALPSIKLCLDWICIKPTVLEEIAFTSRLHIWPGLCVLLNALQNCVDDFKHDQYTKVPLPEDRDLQGFLPLEKSFENLKFTNTDLEGDVATLNKLRAVRIICLGHYLAQHQINGSTLISITSDNGKGDNQFTSMSCDTGVSKEIIRELEELSLNKEKQFIMSASPVLSESSSSKASIDVDISEAVAERRAGILKPQGSLERNRDSVCNNVECSNAEVNSLVCTRKPRQNVAMQAIMRRAESEQKQVTFKNVSPVIMEEGSDKKVKMTCESPSKHTAKNASASTEALKSSCTQSTNTSVTVHNRLSLMPFGTSAIHNQTSTHSPLKHVKLQLPTSQVSQINQLPSQDQSTSDIVSQISGLSRFGKSLQGISSTCYATESFSVQNPQFTKNFMANHIPTLSAQAQEPLTNAAQTVSQNMTMQLPLNQSRPVHQRGIQSIPQSTLVPQSLGTQGNILADISQNMHLQSSCMGLQPSMPAQQNSKLGIKQQSIMQNNLRGNPAMPQNQVNIIGANIANNISGLPPITTYQDNAQQVSSLMNLSNPLLKLNNASSIQVGFDQNTFTQNAFNHLPQKQLSTTYDIYKNSDIPEFCFPSQIGISKNQQQPMSVYPVFHNYEATEFGLWKNARPPQPPVAWWGATSGTAVHNKDTPTPNAFQPWPNPTNSENMLSRVSLAGSNNYEHNVLHDRQFGTRNNFDDHAPPEVDQKSMQSSSTGNTYSLFSGNTWGAGSQITNAASKDQVKARLNQQSLWSGPGPSPLERLLEQQKSLREGGT